MMAQLGVGLIGTGYMGKCHALAFRNAPAVFGDLAQPELACVCDVNPERAQSMAREFGFRHYTTNWMELVENPDVNVVAIAAPNNLHKEIAIAALEQGKHVYCEKPMGTNLEEAKAMTAASQISTGKTLLAYNYLRNPTFKHIHSIVKSGLIGDLLYFRGVCEEDYMADSEVPHSWRCRTKDAGSGALGDLGSHLLSFAITILGPIKSLAAHTTTVYPDRPDPSNSSSRLSVENEDIAHTLFRFENGTSGTMTASRVSWGRKNKLAFDLYGSKGSISFDQERLNEFKLFERKTTDSNKGFQTILTGPAHPPYGQFIPSAGHQLGFNDLKTIEIAELLRALENNTPLYPTFGDGLAVEYAIDGIIRASATGTWIDVSATPI